MSHNYLSSTQSSATSSGGPSRYLFNHPYIILNYIPERLYLASYIRPPTAETYFPYPASPPPASPRKRSQRTAQPTPHPTATRPPCYFTVDDVLLYNAFHHDFGPLHIGHLYRFAIHFHDILGAKQNKDRPIVFWSAPDPRSEFSHAIIYSTGQVLTLR